MATAKVGYKFPSTFGCNSQTALQSKVCVNGPHCNP